ncbi:MAG: carboxypeptidase-like regulatory domain-containing protein [Bacteroidota bacterium]
MVKTLLWILLFLPLGSFAQFIITGKVLNATDKTPVANASVFLNNSATGTKTDDKGLFTMTGVRQGQYDLVVSCVGFETLHKNIAVNADLDLDDMLLPPKLMMLEEVKIKPKYDWAKSYEIFKRHFFGTSGFATQCKIITKSMPDILDLDYNERTRVLTAKSIDYFEIENKALGYKITYSLQEMTCDDRNGSYYYAGTSSFEELKGSNSQKRRWAKHRKEAYEGSSMQFLRSVISNTITAAGFKALRLIRKTDTTHHIRIGSNDFSTLVDKPLNVDDFAKLTDVKGVYALTFSDCLYIMYEKKKASRANALTTEWAAKGWDDAQLTTLIFNKPYALFDNNGIFLDPTATIYEGNWGHRLMGELLPVDYVE